MRQSIFRSTEDLGAFYVKPSGDRSYDRLRILRKRLIHDRRVHPSGWRNAGRLNSPICLVPRNSSPHGIRWTHHSVYCLVEVLSDVSAGIPRGINVARTAATSSNAGMSPSRWPCSAGIFIACMAMIPAWTRLDHTVNQIRLRCFSGFLDAKMRNTPRVA